MVLKRQFGNYSYYPDCRRTRDYHFVATYPDGCVAEDSAVLVTIDDDLPVVTVTRDGSFIEINEVTLTATAAD